MFDVGFSELLLIGAIALIVLGPERLPGAARTVGALLRRARSAWQSVRVEVERELAAEELKRGLKETAQQADIGGDIADAVRDVRPDSKASENEPR